MKKKGVRRGSQRGESVGDRILQLRKARGVTQKELGRLVGLSRRMIAYYEGQGGSPSAELLVELANALDVSTDVLVGKQKVSRRAAESKPDDVRLWRRLKRVRELPAHDRKTVLKMIDALADRTTKRKGG
jgi:transcriptional regulator with XRE-family HTH domain